LSYQKKIKRYDGFVWVDGDAQQLFKESERLFPTSKINAPFLTTITECIGHIVKGDDWRLLSPEIVLAQTSQWNALIVLALRCISPLRPSEVTKSKAVISDSEYFLQSTKPVFS
jgi:hypothetical protein